MRLIDADALDAAFTDLRFNADRTLKHWGDRQDWCLHGSEVEKLIENAPTVSGWVNVKDRLPDKSGPYLVKLGNVFVEHLAMNVYYWDAKIGYWRGSEVHSMIIGITHWMPLPEPPMEE